MDKNKEILIIEDEAAISDVMAEILSQEGYVPHVARNGVEAFEYLADRPKVSLIILDLLMDRMSGYEFLHNLAEREFDDLRHVPIIITSAMTNAHTIAIQKGHGYLAKPVSIDKLLDKISSLLKTASGVSDH